VVSNLKYAMDDLLADSGDDSSKAEFISDKLLAGMGAAEPAQASGVGEAMQLRFDAETKPKKLDPEYFKEYLQSLKIAAVDDDITILEFIGMGFRQAGGEVYTYASGSDFLAAVEREKFDLVFMDLMMPGIDGFAILDSLKGNNIQVPVIVLSSITQRDVILRVFRQGIKSYVTKPFDIKTLFTKVLETLQPEF